MKSFGRYFTVLLFIVLGNSYTIRAGIGVPGSGIPPVNRYHRTHDVNYYEPIAKYIGIKTMASAGIGISGETQYFLMQSVGCYLRSDKKFRLQPEWNVGFYGRMYRGFYDRTVFLQFPIFLVMDLNFVNLKAGVNMEVYKGAQFTAGSGLQGAIGTRCRRIDADLRFGINGSRSSFHNTNIGLSLGYLISR